MRTFVINLASRTDRYAAFAAANRHVPHQFFPAFLGGEIDRKLYEKQGIIAPGLNYSNGAMGCLVSHHFLWNNLAKEPLTICEDDAVLHNDFARHSDATLAALPPDWHICLWGFNFDQFIVFDAVPGVSACGTLFNQDELRRNLLAFQNSPLSPKPYRLRQAFGTMCYSISAAGAAALRKALFPISNWNLKVAGGAQLIPNCGLDVALSAVYASLQAYVVFPPIAVTPNVGSSVNV